MTIKGFREDDLSAELNRLLSPSDPIRSPEFLLGRERNLTEIKRELSVTGRHIFIYGDRGVGKTSLAQTAAQIVHPADTEPLRVAGGEDETFETIVGSIAKRCYARYASSPKAEVYGEIKLPFISLGMKEQIDAGQAPTIASLNDAIDALNYVTSFHADTPVVVIDEFDRVSGHSDKTKFAEMIKQISDQEVDLKIIFCGIGTSMHELLGAHYSTGRAITPIELPRLDHDSLVQIVETAVGDVGLEIDDETSNRVAILSDGFPYFAHLVTEKMIWSAFDDEKNVQKISTEHFGAGIDKAVKHALNLLKENYEKATKKYSDSYEEVLWAIVDKPTLTRQSSSIYEESYLPVMTALKKKPLKISLFYNRLNALIKEPHGHILRRPRNSWFEFSENMMRGYVKLKAAESRVDLGIDHHNQNSSLAKRLSDDFYSA